jgi:histidyl-tRNA synthetase
VWRAERPQQGRYRQFTQCDIDILGVASEVAEIELILATGEALVALGLDGLTVRINDRRVLGAIAEHCGFAPRRFESVFIALDKLDKVGRSGVSAELNAAGHPERAVSALLDLMDAVAGQGSVGAVRELAGRIPGRADALLWDGLARIMAAIGEQAAGALAIEFDATLARGRATTPARSSKSGPVAAPRPSPRQSLRSDDRQAPRRDVPATGFSIGFERGHRPAHGAGPGGGQEPARVAIVFDQDTPHLGAILARARELRDKGSAVLLELRSRRLGKQLQDLEARGFGRIAVVSAEGALEWRDRSAHPTGEDGR